MIVDMEDTLAIMNGIMAGIMEDITGIMTGIMMATEIVAETAIMIAGGIKRRVPAYLSSLRRRILRETALRP